MSDSSSEINKENVAQYDGTLIGNTTRSGKFDNGIITSNDKAADNFFNEYVFNGRNKVTSENTSCEKQNEYRTMIMGEYGEKIMNRFMKIE